jgi:hypothetical protein
MVAILVAPPTEDADPWTPQLSTLTRQRCEDPADRLGAEILKYAPASGRNDFSHLGCALYRCEREAVSMPVYGYARVSSDGQTLDAQIAQLKAAGAEKVFREKRKRIPVPATPTCANRTALERPLTVVARS